MTPEKESADVRILSSEGHGKLTDASTNEVLTMVLGLDDDDVFYGNDITVGRMPVGMDESEFDALPRNENEITPDEAEEYELFTGDAEPFAPPTEETFPFFKKALRHFQSTEEKPRVVRIDTDETYGNFVCEKAIKEIARRVDELRDALEQHMSDEHGPPAAPMRRWDILGAAQSVATLQSARDAMEATQALPQVPLDLPLFAEGKVKCWREGSDIVCSMRFSAVDGTPRIATMAARPRADEEEISRWAVRAGIDPVTVLGVVPDLAAVACGKKLVRDVAGAALSAQRRLDVFGMESDAEPLLLARPASPNAAPLAALMYVQQAADAGDPQALRELAIIHHAAASPLGQKIAAPMLAESRARLEAGRRAA